MRWQTEAPGHLGKFGAVRNCCANVALARLGIQTIAHPRNGSALLLHCGSRSPQWLERVLRARFQSCPIVVRLQIMDLLRNHFLITPLEE